RQDGDAPLLEPLRPKAAFDSKPVRVGRASDYHVALFAQRLSFLTLAERVIEYNEVGPVHLALPVAHLGHETIGDIAFLLVLDAIAHFVTLLRHLPGDVANEPAERDKEKLALVADHGVPFTTAGFCIRRRNFTQLRHFSEVVAP